jgi:basic membrane protein A
LGDKSFNDAANAGLQQAIADGLVCEDNVVTNEANSTGSDRDQNVQALADSGFNLVIGVGFAFSPGINTIGPDYPDTSFMIVDGFATCGTACGLTNDADAIANVADYTFKEQEGSFLVGAAAALKCQCDTIGFLGGQQGTGLIEKFEAGFEAGAKAVNPDMTILVEYIGDDTTAFNDPVKGEALSTKMYDAGAEVIYHASGASGAGLFNAAVEANKLAIGVDSDQYLTASAEQQPLILTSMLKRVDVAVYNAIKAVGDGTFGGSQVFGMAEDGVDYSKSNTAEMTQDIIDQLEDYRAQIISGEIVVPDKPDDV